MTNLLHETIEDIARAGYSTDDIIFIGSEDSGHQCTWQEFERLADIEYDSGFGAQKIAMDLIIVFKNGQKMWRHEYDGSESWHYSEPFKMPEAKLPIHRLIVTPKQVGWETLAAINGKDSSE